MEAAKSISTASEAAWTVRPWKVRGFKKFKSASVFWSFLGDAKNDRT